MKRFLVALSMLVCCIACKKDDVSLEVTSAAGIVKDAGNTYYMYATHILVSDEGKTLYALTSSAVELKSYENTKVEVSGALVKDYPVEDGPQFLDVKSVRVIR